MKSLILIAALSMFAHTATAGSPCEENAYQTLWELGIEADMIKVTKVKPNSKSGVVSSYRHWFKTPLCERGYVVVHTTARRCKTFSTYTQNGCRIKGLKAW